MVKINKKELFERLIAELERELEVAINAAKVAHDDATNEESKPENEYDTRALEASYVARGQAQRVAELKEAIYDFKKTPLKTFKESDPITATALVEVEADHKRSFVFFMPKGGGISVVMSDTKIQVVTPNTPLGRALLKSHKGDGIVVELGSSEKEYEILDVL